MDSAVYGEVGDMNCVRCRNGRMKVRPNGRSWYCVLCGFEERYVQEPSEDIKFVDVNEVLK